MNFNFQIQYEQYDSKEFSLALMSHIVTFYDKTIKETNDKIDQTDSILKTKLEKVENKEIQKTIVSNETKTKKILRQLSSRNTTTVNTNPNLLFNPFTTNVPII